MGKVAGIFDACNASHRLRRLSGFTDSETTLRLKLAYQKLIGCMAISIKGPALQLVPLS